MLTKEQLEQRRKHLGSSDMAAILGLDPWSNACDIFLEKTSQLDDQKSTAVMERGQFIEPAILNYAESELGPLNRNVLFVQHDLHLASNVDGEVIQTGVPIEAKSQGVFSQENWGDPGTDEIPHRVIIQCHVHMICMERDFCHVPAYLPYREFQMFGVKLDPEIKGIICDAAGDFWENHVLKGIPPDIVPNLDILKRIRREPDLVVDLVQKHLENLAKKGESGNVKKAREKAEAFIQNLIDTWQIKNAELTNLKKSAKEAKAAVIAILENAEAGKLPNGDTVTYLEQQRKGYEVKEISFRALRYKKAKK